MLRTLLATPPRVSDFVRLGWDLRIRIVNRLPRATDAASAGPHLGTGCPWALCKEEGPVPSLTFILVAGRIFEVGWIVTCGHPVGVTKALVPSG